MTGRAPLVALNFAEFPDGPLSSEITTRGDWSDGATVCRTQHPTGFGGPTQAPCRVSGGILQADPTGAIGVGLVSMQATVPNTGRLTVGVGGKPDENTSTYFGLCDADGLAGEGVVILAQGDGVKVYDATGTATSAWIVPEDASTPYMFALAWEGNTPAYSVQVNDVEIGTAVSEAPPSALTPFVGALTPGAPTVPTATIETVSGGAAWATLTGAVTAPAVAAPADPGTPTRTGLAIVAANAAGRALAELAPQSGSVTFRLDGTTTVDVDVDGHGELARIEELVTDLVVFMDGRPYTRCRLAPSADDLGADGSHAVKFTAVARPAMLARRLIYPHMQLRYVDATPADIIAGLLEDLAAMPDGDLGIRAVDLAAGDPVTIEFRVGQSFRDALDAVAAMVDGAEWDIDTDNRVAWWPTGRGVTRSFVAEYGGNVERLSRSFDPADYATDLRVSGSDAAVYRTRTRDGARWETQTGDPDAVTAATVAARGDRAANLFDGTPAYTATLNDWSPTRLFLGDTARLIARSGRLNVDTSLRVHEIRVPISPDTASFSTADVTFGRPRPDLVRDFASDRRRLRDLERR